MYANASALSPPDQQHQDQEQNNLTTASAIERADTLEKNPVFVNPSSLTNNNAEMILTAGSPQAQQQVNCHFT